MAKFSISAKKENIDKALEFINNTLVQFKFKGEKLERSLLACEAEIGLLVKHATEHSELEIKIKKKYSTATVRLSAQGKEYSEIEQNNGILKNGESRKDSAMQSLIKEADAGNIFYNHKGRINYIKIFIGQKERVRALQTLTSFALAICCCLLASFFLDEKAVTWCIAFIFNPIQTLLLNALKLITAPAVFFSIMTAVANYASFSDMSSIGKKSIVGHIVSGFLATFIGTVLFILFGPAYGMEGLLSSLVDHSHASQDSLLEVISNAIPDNIIEPFLHVNALQLLIIAVLAGIALAKAGNQVPILNDISSALHKFFKTLVDIVTAVIPFAVFFITSLMIFSFGFGALIATLRIFIIVLVGFVILMLLSVFAVGIFGRLNPFIFIRKMWPQIREAFWSGSSVNVVPDTMELCKKKFGVSEKVYSFSVPFGAISDIDGNCVYLTICGLFTAQICGIDIAGENLIAAAIMVMILSIGSAITPGSAMLALIIIMEQFGISPIVICLILGINSFLELFLAVSNNLREVASTLIIARKENLIDMGVYNKK